MNVILLGKNNFTNMDKLMDLEWRDYSGLFWWAQWNANVLIRGMQKDWDRERRAKIKSEAKIECRQLLELGKARNFIWMTPRESPEGTQLCWPILNFWQINFSWFQSLSLWWFGKTPQYENNTLVHNNFITNVSWYYWKEIINKQQGQCYIRWEIYFLGD